VARRLSCRDDLGLAAILDGPPRTESVSSSQCRLSSMLDRSAIPLKPSTAPGWTRLSGQEVDQASPMPETKKPRTNWIRPA
jgi:hypothetical protein